MTKAHFITLMVFETLFWAFTASADSSEELFNSGKTAYAKDDHVKAVQYLFSFLQLQDNELDLATLNQVKTAMAFSEKKLMEALAVQRAVERGEFDETTIQQNATFMCKCPGTGGVTRPNTLKANPKLVYMPQQILKPVLKAKSVRFKRRIAQKERRNRPAYSQEYLRLREKTNELIREKRSLEERNHALQRENRSLKQRLSQR